MMRLWVLCMLFAGLLSSFSVRADSVEVDDMDKLSVPISAAEIDALVERALVEFNVPGIALGIIKDGRIIHNKGYGVRNLETGAPVTADTLFQIASNSKSMTATALGLLVADGKIDWNDPVSKHLPKFRLEDEWVTRNFTILDMLTHRSGLPLGAGDLLFFPDPTDDIDRVYRALATIPAVSSFRSKYDYDNQLYTLAGQIIESVSGMTYAEFIETRILTPMGHPQCKGTWANVPKGANWATPYTWTGSQYVENDPKTTTLSASAGGVNCTTGGVLSWLQTQMNKGKAPNGTTIYSADLQKELWTPRTIITSGLKDEPSLRISTTMYALGWRIAEYQGKQTIGHTGGLNGMKTLMSIMPEYNLGIVILTNQASGFARPAILSTLQEAFTGIKAPQTFDDFVRDSQQNSSGAEEEMAAAWASRNSALKPSLQADAYTGLYRDEWYGDIQIEDQAGTMRFRSTWGPRLKGDMRHFEGDTWIVVWDDRTMKADAKLTFVIKDGLVTGIRMLPFDPRTDFSFDFQHLNLRPVR
ncbi:serine hydrolase [Kordiimonas sediminis]|uniref:Serine hydrolase n=1 Tax=Kordiimonas sediminis TaxID=1735581 RepID=A0A919AN51_9PROT|nr:serine hydrolase [Kordiimonas sediminis]GHF17916.1 serine hydrolase [Kordiimonas sediminis]